MTLNDARRKAEEKGHDPYAVPGQGGRAKWVCRTCGLTAFVHLVEEKTFVPGLASKEICKGGKA